MSYRSLSFLHGFMGQATDWDEVIASVSRYRFCRDATAVSIEAATDWQTALNEISQRLLERSILVGYSMGARLALGLALQFPERFDGLVLISGNPGVESMDARQQRLTFDQGLAAEIENCQSDDCKRDFLQRWYGQVVFSGTSKEVRTAEVQRKLEHWSGDWPQVLRVLSVAHQPNYWPRMTELVVPTHFVAGQDDEKYTAIATRLVTEYVSLSITYDIVPNCGHIVHREQPEALAQIIKRFVDRLDSKQG